MNGPPSKIGKAPGHAGTPPSFSEGDFQRLIGECGLKIARDPKNADAYRDRGLLHGRNRDYVRALSDLDRAIALNPKDARAYALRGLVRLRNAERQRAVADFDQAIALDPTNADAYRAHKERALGNDTVENSSAPGKEARLSSAFDLLVNPFADSGDGGQAFHLKADSESGRSRTAIR